MEQLTITSLSTLIITVNYKTSRLITELIQSLLSEVDKIGPTHMIIVDNDSQDDSVEYLNKYITEHEINWITVIQNPENSGYASGNNVALEYIAKGTISAERIWFLNPDTKIRPNAGLVLTDAIKENDFHIVGSRLEDDDGTPQCSHFNFPGVLTQLSNGLRLGLFDRLIKNKLVTKPTTEKITQADWLSGASFMITSHYFKTIGLLDNEYFLYFEELDYCLQGNRKNMPCWHIPQSRVYHAVGAATGISDHRKKAPRRPQYWFNSRRRFFLKNYGGLTLASCDLAFILGYSTWKLRCNLTNNTKINKEPPYFLNDFIKNSFIYKGFKL